MGVQQDQHSVGVLLRVIADPAAFQTRLDELKADAAAAAAAVSEAVAGAEARKIAAEKSVAEFANFGKFFESEAGELLRTFALDLMERERKVAKVEHRLAEIREFVKS